MNDKLKPIIIGTLCLILVILTMTVSFEYINEIKHNHVLVEHRYANGIKSYTKEYCLNDSTQVIMNNKHIETMGSKSYFNQNNE